MAQCRMFSKRVFMDGSFMELPDKAFRLYVYLGLDADDEGASAATPAMRNSGTTKDDLNVLIENGLVVVLQEKGNWVYIVDWDVNNHVPPSKFHEGAFHEQIAALKGISTDAASPNEPEQPVVDPEPTQDEPEKPQTKREYRGKKWDGGRVEISDEARQTAERLAKRLDSRTEGAPETSGQKKHAYAWVIQELLNEGVEMDDIVGVLKWLCSDAYSAEYNRGRLLKDAKTLKDDFKILLDKALSAYKRDQRDRERVCAS